MLAHYHVTNPSTVVSLWEFTAFTGTTAIWLTHGIGLVKDIVQRAILAAKEGV